MRVERPRPGQPPSLNAVTRWSDVAPSGDDYAQRFAQLEAAGAEVHGEADLCEALTSPGDLILDAGCGTGRVAIELVRRGRRCVGVDVDRSMLAVAQRRAPELAWVEHDLATLDLSRRFHLVVSAGNVLPLLATGTEAAVVRRLAGHLRAGGLLLSGFGLDADQLPLAEPPFVLAEYDDWCTDAGLELVARYATWDRRPFNGGGYAVSVHKSAAV